MGSHSWHSVPPTRWEEVILGMEEMGGVRYYFICHLNGSHVIQFLKTAIKNVVHAADNNYCIFHPSRIYSNRNNTMYHDHCT